MSAGVIAASYVAGPVLPSDAYAVAVLADSPQAYWRLGELTGTVANDVYDIHDGTYVGTPTLGVAGITTDDKSVQFGNGKYAGFGNILPLDTAPGLTIECWYKISAGQLSTSSSWAPLVTKGDNTAGANAWRLARDNNNVAFQFLVGTNGTGGSLSCPMTTDDEWHHLVGTWSLGGDGMLRLYIDGAFYGAHSIAAPPPGINGYEVRIGGNEQQPLRHWDGEIDEVAVYNYALGADRILAHYEAANIRMPPLLIDANSGGSSGGTTDITAPIPTGFAAGDVLIFAAYRNQGGTFSNPTGWGAPVINQTSPSGVLRLLVWMKIADGTETDPHSTASSAGQFAAVCAAYEASVWENVICNSVDDGGQPCPSGTTTTTRKDTLVHIIGVEHNTTGPGAIVFDPAVTVRVPTTSESFFYRIALGDEARLTPGAVPSRNGSSTNGGWMSYAVIPLRP